MTSNEKIYLVVDEVSGKRFAFSDYERAKEANNVGHWSRRALYGLRLDPPDDVVSVDER